jgi:hypothetical protein
MRYRFAGVLVGIGFLFATVPALAHHATQAEYDKDKPKTLTGVISKIQWINPHVRWYMDVKDETGGLKTWRISGAGPGAFRANGITSRGVFKVGDTYTATIALARDGSDAGYAMTWVMPDGTKMDFWHQYGDK